MKSQETSYSLIQQYKNLRSLIGYYQSQLDDCDRQLSDMGSKISGNALLQQFLPKTEILNKQLLDQYKYYYLRLSDSTKKLKELECRKDFNIEYANDIVDSDQGKSIQILGKVSNHNEYDTDCDTFCNIL